MMLFRNIKGDVTPKPWLTEVINFEFGAGLMVRYHVTLVWRTSGVTHIRFCGVLRVLRVCGWLQGEKG
jgi:hypothetical protein